MRARMGTLLGWAATGPADPEGKFVVKNLPWLPHDFSVMGLNGKYYIKEIRYNGVVMTDGLVRLTQGAPAQNLEIVLDDKVATITGSVRDADKAANSPFMVVVKWPYTEGDLPVSGERLLGDKDGRFRISGLAPGEYRVLGLARPVPFTQISIQLLSRGETVTLERGGLKDLSLKLIDPSK